MTASAESTLRLRISRKAQIAADIVAFELARRNGAELPAFTPGAHVSVTTPGGARRKFSLCNSPAERCRYQIAVKRERQGRGGSASLIDDTDAGDTLEVTAPRNNFELEAARAGYVFIAGGIGITPIVSMIRHLIAAGDTRFKLYYCTRSAEQTAFLEELAAPALRGKVVLHHDGGDPARQYDFWPVCETPAGQKIYCCGPDTLMREVRDMTGHWPSSAVHFETFADAAEPRPADRPFKVRLARSDEVVEIPVGGTILGALRGKGYELRSSCESGTCGTCRTRYLAGEPDHRDLVLRDDERGANIMICVSRARSDELVLDL